MAQATICDRCGMSLHNCPIEPDDWSNGPPDSDGIECRHCEGAGSITDDDDQDIPCRYCDGTGIIEDEPEQDET
jgi:hypothetical protein